MEMPIYLASALVGAISALIVAFFTEYILQGMRRRRKRKILQETFLALVETDLKIWEDSIENYELNTDLFFLMENHLWRDNELDIASLLPEAYPYLARYFRLCEGINKKKFHVNEKFSQETCNYFIELLESAREELNRS